MGGRWGEGEEVVFFSQFYTKIYNFQIAKKNFAGFFRFLPRIIAAIRGRGLEAEKRPNIAIVIPFLYISSQYLYYGMTIFLQPLQPYSIDYALHKQKCTIYEFKRLFNPSTNQIFWEEGS